MMKWRAAAALVGTLLLPVPLVAVFASHWRASVPQPVPHLAKAVVPMLSLDQRRERPTWRKSCHRSTDCDPPLACLFDTNVAGLYCTDSECTTDSQCREGFVCRTVETLGGELLKRCALEGNRREGEGCSPQSKKYASACAPGLLCNEWCGRSCQPDEPESCPEGFFCPREGGPEGPSCLPTCEARGCPPDQACIRFDQGVSVCSVVHGTNCQQSPCPETQRCEVIARPAKPGAVRMRCVARP
ncbi:hypothetical protein [Archangium violaceum]|uniref:Uncharacterized protein n=1 Tax=Archangium violaceum Cb vi76 TaxID=1406225 RepID=A0A084SX38_9BACT|nr:hypothetical protein [Archangium violaceum]KFA93023.1 hypothetical protein Q664_12135 [Archangium violaceum Cb vi76]